MELKHLKSFVTVVNCKSFCKAAEILYTSQPSISTHINLLEQEVGQKLLVRNAKTLSMTEAGEEIYAYACRILELSDRMLRKTSETLPTIHIGTSTVPSAYYLPELLGRYSKQHNITFRITQSDSRQVLEGILDGTYEVGFVGSAFRQNGISCVPLWSDEMVLIAPKCAPYTKIVKSEEAIYKLLKSPLVIREEGSGSGEMLQGILAHYGIGGEEILAAARVNDHEAIKNLVRNGVGVACISKAALRGADYKDFLILELPERIAKRKLYILTREDALLGDEVREFCDFAMM